MASGSISLTSAKAWRGRIDWSSEIDIANNCSYLHVYAGMWKTDGYLTSSNSSTSGTITINGKSYDLTGYQEFKDEVRIFEKTITIPHDADGTKSVSISLSCKGQANTSLASAILSGSGTAVLDQIPRTSSFKATDAAIGSNSTITINRASDKLTHRIEAKIGSVSGYVTNSGGFSTSAATITGASVAFTIPDAFYAAIPNATSGTCTLTLYTMSGSTVIGDAVTTTIKITTLSERCCPILTMTVAHESSDSSALTGSNSKFIRGYSNAKCTVNVTARGSSTIKQIWCADNYVANSDGTYTVKPVNNAKITFYAKDSRGYTGSVSVTVDLVPYVVLTNNAVTGRPRPTDGSAYIKFQGDYYAGSFGAVYNTLSVSYSIVSPNGNETAVSNVTPTVKDGKYYYYLEFASGFDYKQVYTAKITVKDKLLTLYKEIPIKQGQPVFDWGRNDFQFHVPAFINGDRIVHETVLFESADGTDGDVTLAVAASNFECIEVFFVDNNGRTPDSATILNPDGKEIALVAIEPNGSGFYIRRARYKVSGNVLAVQSGLCGYTYIGTSISAYSGNLIKIIRVVGRNRVAAVTSAIELEEDPIVNEGASGGEDV